MYEYRLLKKVCFERASSYVPYFTIRIKMTYINQSGLSFVFCMFCFYIILIKQNNGFLLFECGIYSYISKLFPFSIEQNNCSLFVWRTPFKIWHLKVVSIVDTSHNCIDEIENCAVYQSMGACHALPQQQENYEVAFKCQKTCNRCNGRFICILYMSNIFDKT